MVETQQSAEPLAHSMAIRALTELGLRPRVPVSPESFADPAERERWIEERGMMVFNLYAPDDPLQSVDLFVKLPMPFEELWSRSELIELPLGTVRVASIEDLIEMKEKAGRPRDAEDIEALEALRRGRSTDEQ